MARKENEVAVILRECMRCQIKAPAHLFRGDKLLQDEKLGDAQSEIVKNIETFWRPVLGGEHGLRDPHEVKLGKDQKITIDPF